MKRVVQTLAVLAVLGLVAGGSVIGFGLYNVSARMGHLPGMSWVLHTTFRNSVKLRATKPDTMPDLSDPALIELGARHYDTACKTCHAAPGETRTATMAAMEPAPPHINEAVQDWQPHHLHWIVANGVKMTGMPGWPADRDDDVWPVVAFLVSIQQGMTATGYAGLTQLPDTGDPVAYCLGCHRSELAPYVPLLDHQRTDYLHMSLQAYRADTRDSGFMSQAISTIPQGAVADLLRDIAEGRADQTSVPAPTGGGQGASTKSPDRADLIATGRRLALSDPARRDIAACSACHGPDAPDASDLNPVLAGLPEPYLRRQLLLWRDGNRGGGPRANLMQHVASNLTDGDIDALAAFYATLPPP